MTIALQAFGMLLVAFTSLQVLVGTALILYSLRARRESREDATHPQTQTPAQPILQDALVEIR